MSGFRGSAQGSGRGRGGKPRGGGNHKNDWICNSCNESNFRKKEACFKCGTLKDDGTAPVNNNGGNGHAASNGNGQHQNNRNNHQNNNNNNNNNQSRPHQQQQQQQQQQQVITPQPPTPTDNNYSAHWNVAISNSVNSPVSCISLNIVLYQIVINVKLTLDFLPIFLTTYHY